MWRRDRHGDDGERRAAREHDDKPAAPPVTVDTAMPSVFDPCLVVLALSCAPARRSRRPGPMTYFCGKSPESLMYWA
jgi:hypothetical protein